MSPYITKKRRKELWSDSPNTIGELNYVIIMEIFDYLGIPEGCGIDYEACNEVIGVLECAKQELYRKMVAPYEDKKCKENGEVFNV